MHVYEMIDKYLSENGINHSIIAGKCNMSLSAFDAMINGHKKMYADDLRNICYILNVSPEKFIDYEIKSA